MIIIVTLVLAFFSFLQAQVLTDFDTDSLENWRSEGDGQYYLELDAGNPGNCMRVNDDATGNTNLAIAPLQFIGNWSATDTSDSVMTDFFVSKIGGTLTSNLWAFRISGPGGTATSSTITPVLEQWNHIAISLDSSNWNISSGSWRELLKHVNHFEIRAEFVNGDEFVRLDNIKLTFSPLVVPIYPPIVSNFENGNFEGWTFENSGGVTIPASGGNPGKYIRIPDASGITQAIAPPKYLGDWKELNESAAIMFDLKVSGFTGTLLLSDFLIKITGPGGEATIPMDSAISKAFDNWHTFGFLISQTNWTIENGDWNSLISDIRELRIIVEYIDGSETVWFDNFRISNSPPVAEFSAYPLYLFPGEQVQFSDHSINAPDTWQWTFGDGESSTLSSPGHTYLQAGIYDIELEVKNQFGNDTMLKEEYIEVADITDSILFADDFDDNKIHPAWRFNNGNWVESNKTMIQNSNYYNGGYIGGCYALVGSPEWKNYRLSVDFKSSDDDKIGVVFNYQDANNFYLFTWQQQGTIRALKSFVDGVETNLAIDTLGYQLNQWYQLNLTTIDGQIQVYIDSLMIYSITDINFQSGRAGLYCHGNQNSYWDNFSIENLDYISTDIPKAKTGIIKSYALAQNYPNPFNPITVIAYQLSAVSFVDLSIYNILGQKIKTLIYEEQAAGKYEVTWDASHFAAGIYFYKIEAGEFRQVKKMILLR
jgi:PKD repeat protein